MIEKHMECLNENTFVQKSVFFATTSVILLEKETYTSFALNTTDVMFYKLGKFVVISTHGVK